MSTIVELSDEVLNSLIYVVELQAQSEYAQANPSSGRTLCPYCGREAIYLRTLGRSYCFNCKRYVNQEA